MSDDPAVEAALAAMFENTDDEARAMRRALAAAYEAEADKLKADVGNRIPSDHPTYAGIYGWLRKRAAALRGDSAS